jgi:hypothetical protein
MWGNENSLLHDALESLTGISGLEWNVVTEAEAARGCELQIPELQTALRGRNSLSPEEWRSLKISGLQPIHFVRAGGRVLKPTERVRSHVTKWLDSNKVPMDLNTFENLFVVCNPGIHYLLHRSASAMHLRKLRQQNTPVPSS